jgi:hypothetical protein
MRSCADLFGEIAYTGFVEMKCKSAAKRPEILINLLMYSGYWTVIIPVLIVEYTPA